MFAELLHSADEAGQHRYLTAVARLRSSGDSNIQSAFDDDDDSAAAKYRLDFRRLVLAALWRSVEEARARASNSQRASDEGPWNINRRTVAWRDRRG